MIISSSFCLLLFLQDGVEGCPELVDVEIFGDGFTILYFRFEEKELAEDSVVRNYFTTAADGNGKDYVTHFNNLEPTVLARYCDKNFINLMGQGEIWVWMPLLIVVRVHLVWAMYSRWLKIE